MVMAMAEDLSTAQNREKQHDMDLDIPAKDRLIVALDVNNLDETMGLVNELGDTVSFYKVGFELMLHAGLEPVRMLKLHRRKNVFFDLKMDDVKETIIKAMRGMVELGVDIVTIHGNGDTAKAALEGRGTSPRPKIVQITYLTSHDGDDLRDLGLLGPGKTFQSVDQYVDYRAAVSIRSGCDGLISSGRNVAELRKKFLPNWPILICPGIRPAGLGNDDHKRPYTPYESIRDGADYIVVGRPIRDASNRLETAQRIIDDIQRGLDDRAF